MKRRKLVIMALLMLSWPMGLVHRCMNGWPEIPHKMFPFDSSKITYQWYTCFLCQGLSYCMVFMAIWMAISTKFKRDWHVVFMIRAIVVVQFVDFLSFVLFFRHSEWILLLESFIMLYPAVDIYLAQRKK